MPSLEPVVRPFQSPGIINDKKVRVTRVLKVTTERAIITWGSAGDAPETKQVGIKVTVKGVDVQKPYSEKSRKTTDIRVENPNDSSQYVMVRRIDEIKFTRHKPFSDNLSGQPTDVPPANQSSRLNSPPPSTSTNTGTPVSSRFNDGSTGTTTTKTDGTGGTTTFVDGNTNVTATSNAGTSVTTAEKRTETETFTLKWNDTGAGS